MNKFLMMIKEYKLLLKFWLIFLAIGFTFRLTLSLVFLETINADLFYGLLYGVRMDTMFFSAFSIIFSILYALNLIKTSRIFFTTVLFVYLVIEVATLTFMDKFLSRPNALFVEHLANYEEVLLMVWGLYKFYLIVAIPLVLFATYKIFIYFKNNINAGDIKHKLILLPLILIILFLGARSSVGMAPPNQSFYTFSSNDINNEIANTSVFSILYSLYLIKKEKFYNYGNISEEEAIERVKKLNNIENNTNNLNRFQQSGFDKKKNVILVILESFGHEHIGYMGGTPTTPNLDALTKESLYFTNLYAIGTRTSWGVSSVTTGLYPIPSREYVKASKSQKNFYTIARSLKKEGYKNTFLYSGDANFDNMRGFLKSNGYADVYGKEDFDSSKIKYTWGYADEDLYEKAFTIIEEAQDKPYFLTLLTMSSHEPFDYPKGIVEPYEDAKLDGFANSIKYSDYAIGKFMKKLKDKGMLENTVVAFIADHTNNTYNSTTQPTTNNKIAALIVSDDFKGGQKYDKLASQIDFAPTILDIAGISQTIPTMGTSVLQNERDSALLLTHNKSVVYLLPQKMIIYQDKQNYKTYDYNKTELPNNNTEIKDGLSYIYSSKYLYENSLYK